MARVLTTRPFKICPKCRKKGFRATNESDVPPFKASHGMPIMRCRYCGYKELR